MRPLGIAVLTNVVVVVADVGGHAVIAGLSVIQRRKLVDCLAATGCGWARASAINTK